MPGTKLQEDLAKFVALERGSPGAGGSLGTDTARSVGESLAVPGSTLLQPTSEAQSPQVAPEDLETRKGGWKDFLTALRERPDANEALIRFGLGLMQPRAPGQTQAGAFGQAATQSLDFLQANKAAKAKGALEERRVGATETQAAAATMTAEAAMLGAEAKAALAKQKAGKELTPTEKMLVAMAPAIAQASALFADNPEENQELLDRFRQALTLLEPAEAQQAGETSAETLAGAAEFSADQRATTKPNKATWLAAARTSNPGIPDSELEAYYNQKYGG